MASDFTNIEIRLIRNLLSIKSDEDISIMLGRPVAEVSVKINELTGGHGSFSEKLKEKQNHNEILEERKNQRLLDKRLRAERKLQLRHERSRETEENKKLRQEKRSLRETEKRKLKQKDPKIISRRIEQEQKTARTKRYEPAFKTKVVNYSEMKAVRIDQRTIIYAKHGEDPEVVKKKYLANQKLPKNIAPAQRGSTVEVKKFKPIK